MVQMGDKSNIEKKNLTLFVIFTRRSWGERVSYAITSASAPTATFLEQVPYLVLTSANLHGLSIRTYLKINNKYATSEPLIIAIEDILLIYRRNFRNLKGKVVILIKFNISMFFFTIL